MRRLSCIVITVMRDAINKIKQQTCWNLENTKIQTNFENRKPFHSELVIFFLLASYNNKRFILFPNVIRRILN